jgi:polysaccharide deacetylase family protein (PEP-CTERM system associated)
MPDSVRRHEGESSHHQLDLLLGIDLEDVRDHIPDGARYQDRLGFNVERILRFLDDHQTKATFFTVGLVARRLPSLIKTIADEGHELASHSDRHVQLNKLTPEEFSSDLRRSIDTLEQLASIRVSGFRAPTFSLIPSCEWAYDVFVQHNLLYSSSVLAAKNPLFGWPGFGTRPCRMRPSLIEIPVSLHRAPLPRVPLLGGVYLRILPFSLTRISLFRHNRELPVTSYMHPYDIDQDQERFMHPDLDGNRLMNWLMYRNRKKILARLSKVMTSCRSWRYIDWVDRYSSEIK